MLNLNDNNRRQIKNGHKLDLASSYFGGDKNEDLKVDYLPSPPLRTFSLVESLRDGIRAKQLTLPRIIAIKHDDEGLIAAAKLIKELPKGSKVAIEFQDIQVMSKEARQFYAKNQECFTKLALEAEDLGHKVILLERASAHFDSKSLDRLRRIGALVKISKGFRRGSAEWVKAVGERLELLNQHSLDTSLRGNPVTSAWRSELMARKIARVSDWKSSDVVLVGSAHAVNLAKILGVEVDQFIGVYRSEVELLAEMKIVMEGQCALAEELKTNRLMAKILFAIKHPFNFWKGYLKKSNKIE